MKKVKHRKAIMISLIILVIVIAIPLGLYVGGNYYFSDARIFEGNWNIVFPTNIKETYSKNKPTDFQGHGSRYAVFQMKSSNAAFLSDSSNEKNSEMEKTVSKILNDIGVNQNEYPVFSNSYRWKIISKYTYKLYVVYDNKSSLLYLIQDMP